MSIEGPAAAESWEHLHFGNRCLSLMGISHPYEDTLNSEAKEGTGLEPEAGASGHSLPRGSFSREALLT